MPVLSVFYGISEGEIPPNKKKLVAAWIEIHKEDLQANWKLLGEGEQSFRIEPLR